MRGNEIETSPRRNAGSLSAPLLLLVLPPVLDDRYGHAVHRLGLRCRKKDAANPNVVVFDFVIDDTVALPPFPHRGFAISELSKRTSRNLCEAHVY
jgi:hypothetical protein